MFLSYKSCFGFCGFGFAAIPHPNRYLTSILDKTHHGPLIASFLVNDLQLEIQKICSYLKNVALGFVLLVLLEAVLHPSCCLTSIVDKTHHGPVFAPNFSVQLL